MPKYGHVELRNGVIRCQTALLSGPATPASPRSPGFCIWSPQWPALGSILNAPFNASKWLPGPCGCAGLGWAGSGGEGESGGGGGETPPPGGPGGDWRGPGGVPGVKSDQNLSFPVDTSGPKYDHAGPRNGVLRCQTALWSGPATPASPRPPGFCTWSPQGLALGSILNAPFGVPKWLPGHWHWWHWPWSASPPPHPPVWCA